MNTKQRMRRSREGCWTCRWRKKKCDRMKSPCGNCVRLGLQCDTQTRLVWEDDARRAGMKRRGPPKARRFEDIQSSQIEYNLGDNDDALEFMKYFDWPFEISQWPFRLDSIESLLLDYYIRRFSKTYPILRGPMNPWLRVFVPLSMQSRVVLDGLLALSAVQTWENGKFGMEKPMLFFRQRALRGCSTLVSKISKASNARSTNITDDDALRNLVINMAHSPGSDDVLYLLATCLLLHLFEKLSGETQHYGTTHLHFFIALFPVEQLVVFTSKSLHWQDLSHWHEAMRFISSAFLYNDLVRSTSFRTSTLSNFYLGETTVHNNGSVLWGQQLRDSNNLEQLEFPNIIARISAGDVSITDAEIAAWSGSLDWFPSLVLNRVEESRHCKWLLIDDSRYIGDDQYQQLRVSEKNDQHIISELYRVAASVYRQQQLRQNAMTNNKVNIGSLPSSAVALLRLLPIGSSYENSLLWPISIVAPELTNDDDRNFTVSLLKRLEQRFGMKYFLVAKEHLVKAWAKLDKGITAESSDLVLLG